MSVAETVTGGSLLLAIPLALLAGFVSFASPCVLPLVPGYVGVVTGMTGAELDAVAALPDWRCATDAVLVTTGMASCYVMNHRRVIHRPRDGHGARRVAGVRSGEKNRRTPAPGWA